MLTDYIINNMQYYIYVHNIYICTNKFVFIPQLFLNINKIYELIVATNVALIAVQVFKY